MLNKYPCELFQPINCKGCNPQALTKQLSTSHTISHIQEISEVAYGPAQAILSKCAFRAATPSPLNIYSKQQQAPRSLKHKEKDNFNWIWESIKFETQESTLAPTALDATKDFCKAVSSFRQS
jgi:hypothetical protein